MHAAALCSAPPQPGGTFYSAKNWVGNCPPATYAPVFYSFPEDFSLISTLNFTLINCKLHKMSHLHLHLIHFRNFLTQTFIQTTYTYSELYSTLTCLINMHACLLGTFCFSKGKRSFCLSLLKLQNVPNKHACMFIRQVRVNIHFPNRQQTLRDRL